MEIYEDNSEYILEEFKSELELIQNYLECKKENSFESKRDEILEKFRRRQAEIKLKLISICSCDICLHNRFNTNKHLDAMGGILLIIFIIVV